MSSSFGHSLKVQIFGASHGKAIGVVVDGFPAGFHVDMEALRAFMDRRRPGASRLTTQRTEADAPDFVAGIEDGVLTGSPLACVIANTNTRSRDYDGFRQTPRPSHADFTALLRYGEGVDIRGGGHFSGRLTAPLCVAGGIALQILREKGILIGAHLSRVGDVTDDAFPFEPKASDFEAVLKNPLPTISEKTAQAMSEVIEAARQNQDSVGAIVEVAVTGMPAGIGSPMFDGIENRLASTLFGIPAVRGVEFGAGFKAATMTGSKHNDAFTIEGGRVRTKTNNAGGILGGISTGMPIVARVAFKPTASISQVQDTVDLKTMTPTQLTITGRHDPCIGIRAVPVVEAVTALVIYDFLAEATHGSY